MDTLDWDTMPIIRSASCSFDPIDMISRWNICQRQEAATRLAADSVAAKSRKCPSSDCTKVGSPFSTRHNNMPKFCGLMANSSGDFSAIDANDSNNIDQCPVKKLDEMVLQSSSHNLQEIPRRSSEAKCYKAKRSHDHILHETDFSTGDSSFQLISKNQPKSKKLKSDNKCPRSSNINFQQASSSTSSLDEPDSEAIAQMKEMIYRDAAFKPMTFSTDEVQKPKRKNVRISTDPQTVAARQRRERISEKIKILQKMVPGGSKMDTASMLDEAANYLKFLRTQVKELEAFGYKINPLITNFSPLYSIPFNKYPFFMQHNFPLNSIHSPMS